MRPMAGEGTSLKGPKKERLDVLLVQRGLCSSRTRAQARILAGDVVVDDQRVDKAGTQVSMEAELRLKGEGLRWASRGGLKLVGALDCWELAVENAICVDVGASTGGFTDVLLHRGARQVYAVDVGYGQLAWRLRQDSRVVNLERTHIVHLAQGALDPPPEVAVVDVSFISLLRVLPALASHLAPAARVVALVKPQFEVGKERVGKGGIVREPSAREDALAAVIHCGEHLGWRTLGHRESPIQGAEGNIEFLCAFCLPGGDQE